MAPRIMEMINTKFTKCFKEINDGAGTKGERNEI